MSDVKACPFCGKDGCYVDKEGLAAGEGKITLDIACAHTSCMPPSSYVPAKSWQSRPIEDALCAEVARLTAALEAAEATIHELRAELAAAEYLLSEGDAHNPADLQP